MDHFNVIFAAIGVVLYLYVRYFVYPPIPAEHFIRAQYTKKLGVSAWRWGVDISGSTYAVMCQWNSTLLIWERVRVLPMENVVTMIRHENKAITKEHRFKLIKMLKMFHAQIGCSWESSEKVIKQLIDEVNAK